MRDQISKPDFATTGIPFPEALKGLVDDPPLLEGEDPKLYWSLLAAVVEDEKPQSIMEYIDVIDQVNKVWEEQRLRRVSVGLIRGQTLTALKFFLEPIREMKNHFNLAREYFSDDPKERKEVESRLAQYGITPTEVHAKAAQLNRHTLQLFERMAVERANARRQLRKDKRNRRQETDRLQ